MVYAHSRSGEQTGRCLAREGRSVRMCGFRNAADSIKISVTRSNNAASVLSPAVDEKDLYEADRETTARARKCNPTAHPLPPRPNFALHRCHQPTLCCAASTPIQITFILCPLAPARAPLPGLCAVGPAVTDGISSSLHVLANEPSLGLYRMQEHVSRAVPELVETKRTMKKITQRIQVTHRDSS